MSPSAEKSEESPSKTYGLMCVVRDQSPHTGKDPDGMVPSWPYLLRAELLVLIATMLVCVALGCFFDAPLREPANPALPENPAKAPWYFLGLQELVSYHAFIGGVAIPGLLAGLVLLYPYIEMFVERLFGIRDRGGQGVWFARQRWLENLFMISIFAIMGLLIIIGTYFRGPNWEFVTPFQQTEIHQGGH